MRTLDRKLREFLVRYGEHMERRTGSGSNRQQRKLQPAKLSLDFTTNELSKSKKYNHNNVGFPWFSELPSPEETKAYSDFICKLCEFTVNAKRVTASEKETENEKYAFRCFLLRLGFIGEEYKQSRKILLKNLSGSSAFKNGGQTHEISE